MKMAKKNVNSTILLIVVAAVIVFLGMAYLIYSQIRTGSMILADIATAQISLQQEKNQLKALQDLQKKYSNYKELIATYQEIMPEVPKEDQLIGYLYELAEKTGTHLVQLSFQEKVNGENYMQLPFKMTFEGQYKELSLLLNDIRNGTRPIRVDEILVVRAGEETENLKADITACAFYQGTEENVNNGTQDNASKAVGENVNQGTQKNTNK